MAYVLGIATLLGGIAAIYYFVDRSRQKNTFENKQKIVDDNWLNSSDIKRDYGDSLRWSDPEKVEHRLSLGYEIVYQKDEQNKIRYRLVNSSGQTLIVKRNSSSNR